MKVLDVGYLFRHFLILIATVKDRYGDLLAGHESLFLERYLSLTEDAQKLLLRLLSRSAKWYQIKKLSYPEIVSIREATDELVAQGLLKHPKKMNLADLMLMMSKDECVHLVSKEGKFRSSSKKHDYVHEVCSALSPQVQDSLCFDERTRWARPSNICKDVFAKLQYLYFGNSNQTLTEFVLEELETMRYEKYSLSKDTRVFADRASFEDSIRANQLYGMCSEDLQQVDCALSEKALFEIQYFIDESLKDSHPRSHRRYHKLKAQLGRSWERRKNLKKALDCYEGLSLAAERRLRCLAKLSESRGEPEAKKFHEKAQAEAREIWEKGEADGATLEYCAKLIGVKDSLFRGKELRLEWPKSLSHLGVEESALALFGAEGWRGWHTENALLCSLYGLVFWDALFEDVPGAFFHPFQLGPADVFSGNFSKARKASCEKALKEFLEDSEGKAAFWARWEAKQGLANFWVAWHPEIREALDALLELAPRQDLAKLLEHMLKAPGRFDSGFPDLFLVRGEEFQLWEVKGPGDRLRPEQRSWLEFFDKLGWKAGVCHLKREA